MDEGHTCKVMDGVETSMKTYAVEDVVDESEGHIGQHGHFVEDGQSGEEGVGRGVHGRSGEYYDVQEVRHDAEAAHGARQVAVHGRVPLVEGLDH